MLIIFSSFKILCKIQPSWNYFFVIILQYILQYNHKLRLFQNKCGILCHTLTQYSIICSSLLLIALLSFSIHNYRLSVLLMNTMTKLRVSAYELRHVWFRIQIVFLKVLCVRREVRRKKGMYEFNGTKDLTLRKISSIVSS